MTDSQEIFKKHISEEPTHNVKSSYKNFQGKTQHVDQDTTAKNAQQAKKNVEDTHNLHDVKKTITAQKNKKTGKLTVQVKKYKDTEKPLPENFKRINRPEDWKDKKKD